MRDEAVRPGRWESAGTVRGGRLALLILVGLTACAGGSDGGPAPSGPAAQEPTIPAVGSPGTLDLGTWNLEWFGDAGNGPTDEALQLARVAGALGAMEGDIWGVQEVVEQGQFRSLIERLPGYSGLLANDPTVAEGPAHYNDFGGNEQKVGIVYRDSVAELVSARLILTEHDYAFAGRPPLEAEFELRPDGRELFVIVLHAKAGTQPEDHDRRAAGAAALKDYLDARPTRPVVVLGDFNDDMDESILVGRGSPYSSFVGDSASYRIPTLELTRAGRSSMVRYPDPVDHHLVTDEVWSAYLAGSATAVRLDEWIENYGETTTDHFPVVSRYRRGE